MCRKARLRLEERTLEGESHQRIANKIQTLQEKRNKIHARKAERQAVKRKKQKIKREDKQTQHNRRVKGAIVLREQRCAPWIAPFAEALPIQGYSKPKCNEAPAIDLLPFQVDSHVFVRLGCSRFRRVPCPGLLAFHVCSSPDPKNPFRNVRYSCLEKLKRITSVWNHTIWFRFCFLCLRLANPIQVADFRCS